MHRIAGVINYRIVFDLGLVWSAKRGSPWE